MIERIRALSSVRIVTYILFFLSLGMLAITTFMAFNSFNVLAEWTLTLPDKRIEAGDKVVIQSVYNKLRTAEGDATRYLECKDKNGVFLRYELNQRRADRKAGKGGTGIDVVVPAAIPDLPTTCKFSVSICYDTFLPWYCYPESETTKEFILYPPASTSVPSESDGSQRTSQTPVPAATSRAQSGNPSVSSSSSQSTSASEPAPTNSSQKSDNATLQQGQPSGPTLIDGARDLVGGIVKLITGEK